ncbi:beta-galactosidase [Nonomuraea roseola]|uniref:Beta-galactosidase n=1 Tax=Nonomuraea roseola TaxID=46179 RepID=A0ABV5PZ18_9ACTN
MSSPLNVRVADGCLLIDDEPRLLLCASLFYFRIARGQWRERLRAVRESGYTCVDVYFPWNHHELAPGVWDFDGERDVAAFLAAAHEEGLLVLARPGPYICSEWDGGALPAWLPLTEGLRLRDNEPLFLDRVRDWFDRIMPILRDAEAVVAVQLENELDFFDCADVPGYIGALRDMALDHGITVPLIACAGQGDLARASGETRGVLPAANFYPSDDSLAVESVADVYGEWLRARGLPLLVTETNRAHVTLRRLLSTGVRLLGPYLQVSGNDFGFTTGVTNWGDPLALLTSDYDFGGYLSPSGVRRQEFGEGRLLAGLVTALGPALAAAVPADAGELKVRADFPLPDGGPRALALAGGGLLLALANPGGTAGTATIGDSTEVRVPAGSCPFVLLDVPLHGTLIRRATAELVHAAPGLLVFTGDSPCEVVLAPGEGDVVLEYQGRGTSETRVGELRVLFLSRADAAALKGISPEGSPVFDDVEPTVEAPGAPALRRTAFEPVGPATALGAAPVRPERLGAYRGYTWYAAESEPADSFLLHSASDVLSLHVGGRYLGTVTPGGGFARLDGPAGGRVEVRTEIWGHPNFDDARLPALRLGSLRGFDAVTAVRSTRVLGPWRLRSAEGGPPVGAAPAPLAPWGGWITAHRPDDTHYVTDLLPDPGCDSWILHLDGVAAHVEVRVDGVDLGVVNPRDPYIDLTPALDPGVPARLELTLRRRHGESAGEAVLLEGRRASQWSANSADEAALWQAATSTGPGTETDLPVRLAPGELCWLHADLTPFAGRTWTVRLTGERMKLTAWFNGRVVGRLWLPGDPRPSMRGGDPELLTLPASWFAPAGGDRLSLLAESVHRDLPGQLTGIAFGP